MFIRVKSTPNSPRKSVQIVESVRDGEKVRQKIIRHVGIAMDDKELEKLKEVAQFIKCKIEDEHTPSFFPPEEMAKMVLAGKKEINDDPLEVNLKELKEEQRNVIGIHEVYGKIFDEIGFNTILEESRTKTCFRDILRHMIMARIASPSSKRASVIQLENDFGISLPLQSVYRMMDKLDAQAQSLMEKRAFIATQQVLGGKIDVIFVDATTLYFESFIEDDFKKCGYSKDLKFNQPQVLFALLVTDQGLPIGYEAFEGSMYEGHTLIPMLDKISNRHKIGKVVFVADSGLLNQKNLALLEEKNYDYIVGARLKNTTKDLKNSILNSDNYSSITEDISISEFTHQERRLIVTHSKKRARKDENDRNQAIEKLEKKLNKNKNSKSFLSNYGYKKYLKSAGESSYSLDQNKIEKDKQWDGLHGMVTNSNSLTPSEVIKHYRGLWQVEESFRISKTDLKIRPIYHWTPERIKSHIALCFMSFTCVRHLEYRVSLQYKKLSPNEIRRHLIHIQASILSDKSNNRYVLPSKGTQEGRKIYQVMGLKYSTTPYKLQKM